jgi:TolA-binding protein
MGSRAPNLWVIINVVVAGIVIGWSDDFTIAEQEYEKGRFSTAEVFFKAVLQDTAYSTDMPDAAYYLTRIYKSGNDIVGYIDGVNFFLTHFAYDQRCTVLLQELLVELCEQGAYRTAYHYMHRYDHLVTDLDMLIRIGIGLYAQNDMQRAGQVLRQCSLQDTVLILLASLTDDRNELYNLYARVRGVKGTIYTVETMLEDGDTISAFDLYQTIDGDIEPDHLLYRYALLGLLFDKERMEKALQGLEDNPEFRARVGYMRAMITGNMAMCSVPSDQEECQLYAQCIQATHYACTLPDSAAIDSIDFDSLEISEVERLRSMYPGCFIFDSLYCEVLLRSNMVDSAFSVVQPYLGYMNTQRFVRFIRGIQEFHHRDYAGALKDILLSQNNEIRAEYILGRASVMYGRDAFDHYETVLSAKMDSTFQVKTQREYMQVLYEHERYREIIALPYEIVTDDDSLLQIYIYSLAHNGQVEKADSLAKVRSNSVDPIQVDHYGQYLIANKAFNTARFLYDSLYGVVDEPLPPAVQYNWALVPLLQGQVDTALFRFKQVMDRIQPGRPYYLSTFKCATIHYLKENFDSAAYYYGIAKADDSLKVDALQNQMICYKKAAEWKGVMVSAEELLSYIHDDSIADIYFEYGYAQLRYGDFREAIDNFHAALRVFSSPEYHFWLAETFLARGSFERALYHYRTIMDQFPKDEMWTPTAWYKVGITLEFMDELEEARSLYHDIIKKRGASDTWGVEAQKRLDILQ